MTTLTFNGQEMIVGSEYFPAGKARDQQVHADLLTAVSLDHSLEHGVAECDVCLAVEWGLHASAAAIMNDLKRGFCSTLLEILGSEAEPSPAETEKFREIRGAEEPQDAPTEEG